MKIGKMWLTVLMVSVVLVCFGLSTGHAQDLSSWENTWFSITASASGWEIEAGSTTISTAPKVSIKGFLNLGDLAGGALEADLWAQNLEGEWKLLATSSCDYVAGSGLDVICELNGFFQQPLSGDFDTFIRIQGKLNTKTFVLKSATLKSSGGLVDGHLDEEFLGTRTVGGVTLSGKWLDLTNYCKSTKNVGTPPYADCPK